MAIERTFSIIKPDATARNITGAINAMIEKAGLRIIAQKRVKIALQGHAPIAAATQAVYDTLKALREGTPPKQLKGLASGTLTGRVTRDAETRARAAAFLGLE